MEALSIDITPEMIQLLIENDIDSNIQNEEGNTPLHDLFCLDLGIIYKESVCCACQDNEPDIIIQNCNHNCICSDCFSDLQRSSSSCPMCREHIDNHTTIYEYAYHTSNIWIL